MEQNGREISAVTCLGGGFERPQPLHHRRRRIGEEPAHHPCDAMATKHTRQIQHKQPPPGETREASETRSPSLGRSLTCGVRGRVGGSQRAKEERGHQQRPHRDGARVPSLGRHWQRQQDNRQVGEACCEERFRGHGRRPSGQGEGGREAGNAQIEDGEWEKPPGIRAFLELREGRRGEERD